MAAAELFSAEEIERSRRYHRPLYAAFVLGLALALAVLVVLSFTRAGSWLLAPVEPLPWWLQVPLYTALVLLVSALVRLPLALWRGWWRERRWGLSTQSLRGFLADWAKGYAVGVALTGLALLGLATLVRLAPSAWPLLAAVAAASLVLLLGFVAPVLLEPIFNRFEPLADESLHARLRALGERAGTPVRYVLVADASRRTRKLNAYVSGVGRTRRVVLFDTLLERAQPREVETVVAHELAHRRERHVLKLTLLGMAGAALGVLAVWLVLGNDAGNARHGPHVLLLLGLLELVAMPPFAALSRRWERVADRVMLELTHDPETCESKFRTLAAANVADLDPPRALHVLTATHPTIPERIAFVRRFAGERAKAA